MKKMALHWRILIGMAAGVVFAGVVTQFSGGKEFIINWIKPFGTVFINALKLIAIPLILASLIKGIADLDNLTKLSRMGLRTIAMYLATTVIAVCLGLVIVNFVQPGKAVSEDTRVKLIASYEKQAGDRITAAEKQKQSGPLKPLEDLVPENIFAAASSNGNMLQVIVFAIFFGIGLILIPKETGEPVKAFFAGLNDVVLKMIDLIMLAAPIGVFALLAAIVAEAPGADLFVALLWYAFTVLLGLATLYCFYIFLVWVFTRRSPKFFLGGIIPAQLLAFSTSSSAATLPVTMERTIEHLGVDEDVASFVLPIGATVNMDGTSLYQAAAAVFIAQVFGMDLSLTIQLGIIVTATLASIGSAAVPGAGMVMLVIVLAQAGIPEVGLALIFAIDRPLDMCRTTINVTGDATVSMIVANSLGMLGKPETKNWDDNLERVL